jgi:hypothetical protein
MRSKRFAISFRELSDFLEHFVHRLFVGRASECECFGFGCGTIVRAEISLRFTILRPMAGLAAIVAFIGLSGGMYGAIVVPKIGNYHQGR